MIKDLRFIWSICCELFNVGCAFIPKYLLIFSSFAIGIGPFIISYFKEKQKTKRIEIIEAANTERTKIESQTRIEERKIDKETILGIAAISPPEPEEIKKHNQDNLFYFEDTVKKRMTQITSEREHDADKSLPAYYENLKEDISNDANGFDCKSMLQNLLNKDDDDET